MEHVQITGLEMPRTVRITERGHSILAHFSCDVGVFSFRGCVLVRTNRDGIAAWLPRLDDHRGGTMRSVTLNDEPTRNAILKAAREMYIRMGGKHAAWTPRELDEDAPDEPETGGVVRFLNSDAA